MLLRENKIIHCLKCNREKGIKLDRRRLFGLCLWIWALASCSIFFALVWLCFYCGCIFTLANSLSFLVRKLLMPLFFRRFGAGIHFVDDTACDRLLPKTTTAMSRISKCMEMTTILMHKMHINWIAYGFLMMHYLVVIFIVLLLLRLPSIWICIFGMKAK